jgi:transcriptional regulator with XRE-family HTH domain
MIQTYLEIPDGRRDSAAMKKPTRIRPPIPRTIEERAGAVLEGANLLASLPSPALQFGDRIALVRSIAGWTQTKLAKSIGVSRGAVSQWEANKTFPSAVNLRKIATLLKVSFDWLATGDGPSPLDDKAFPVAEGLKVSVEFTVHLNENTTLEEAAKKLREIKESVEAQGSSVTGFVQIGQQKIKL